MVLVIKKFINSWDHRSLMVQDCLFQISCFWSQEHSMLVRPENGLSLRLSGPHLTNSSSLHPHLSFLALQPWGCAIAFVPYSLSFLCHFLSFHHPLLLCCLNTQCCPGCEGLLWLGPVLGQVSAQFVWNSGFTWAALSPVPVRFFWTWFFFGFVFLFFSFFMRWHIVFTRWRSIAKEVGIDSEGEI